MLFSVVNDVVSVMVGVVWLAWYGWYGMVGVVWLAWYGWYGMVGVVWSAWLVGVSGLVHMVWCDEVYGIELMMCGAANALW